MTEEKRIRDAIAHTQEMLYSGSLTAWQKERISVLMRMSYYLGMLEDAKQHKRIAKRLMIDDGEETM